MLYGITCTFLDNDFQVRKLVLGLPELTSRHTGENIAAEVIEILSSYEIDDKIGYFTLDNATNNDTAMEAISDHYGFEDGPQRRIRCIGHIINLVVKALLFGKNYQAFEEDIPTVQSFEIARHKLWQKTGPVGKLHNLVTWINRSNTLTQAFLQLQKDYNNKNPSKPIKVLHLVSDNATRWLSQFYMIERALKLRNFIEDLRDDQLKAYRRSSRSEKDLPPCLHPDAELTASDWSLLGHMYNLLNKFNVVLKVLEGDGQIRERVDGSLKAYGLIWNVAFAFEFMLEMLEAAKTQLVDEDHAKQWRVAVNCAWDQLDKYYRRLDDSPIYYAAVALHPRYRWRYFDKKWADRPDWISSAKWKVKDLWESQYKDRPISDINTLQSFQSIASQTCSFDTPFDTPFDAPTSQISSLFIPELAELPEDEYERWRQHHPNSDTKVENPLEYWYNKRSEYPRLAQMAMEILSIPPMSAECERLFSSSGIMVTPLRSRLEAITIGLAQTLRSWLKAGVVRDSVMDVADLSSNNHDKQGLDAVENDFNEDFEVEGYATGAFVGDEIEMYIELS